MSAGATPRSAHGSAEHAAGLPGFAPDDALASGREGSIPALAAVIRDCQAPRVGARCFSGANAASRGGGWHRDVSPPEARLMSAPATPAALDGGAIARFADRLWRAEVDRRPI